MTFIANAKIIGGPHDGVTGLLPDDVGEILFYDRLPGTMRYCLYLPRDDRTRFHFAGYISPEQKDELEAKWARLERAEQDKKRDEWLRQYEKEFK